MNAVKNGCRAGTVFQRLAAGVLLFVAGGIAPAPAGTNALYVNNSTLAQVGRQALTSLNFQVTTLGDANFITTNLLATGQWDVVVIEQYGNRIMTNAALALQGYVQNGGAVVLNYWDMDGSSGDSSITSAPILRATFGVQAAVDFFDPLNIYTWQPYPIFATPYPLSGLATNAVTMWDRNGERMEPAPGAYADAGFTAGATYQQAAIIVGIERRTVMNGFLFDNMDLTNGPLLLQNEITYAAMPSVPHTYASDGSYADRIHVSWRTVGADTCELFRNTNIYVLAQSLGVFPGSVTNYDDANVLPGESYLYYVIASNAFGARQYAYADYGWRRSLDNRAVGDYDGDGKADPAIYIEATGEWRVLLSGSGYAPLHTTLGSLGGPGYAAVAADYDGDGRTDPAVYRESNGQWRIMLSSAGYALFESTLINLGGPGLYTAFGADFDGDGFADPTVFQAPQGWWTFELSSYNYEMMAPYLLEFPWGINWNSVAWADYDGDGYADPCIYQETTGMWNVLLSGSGYALVTTTMGGLGGLGFIPVSADYDGDGKADPAVCNLATGEWRVLLSGSGYALVDVHLTF